MRRVAELDEARANGDVTYWTGRPCRHGHLSLRLTSSRQCLTCRDLRVASQQHKDEGKAWRATNAERIRQNSKAWHSANPDYTKSYRDSLVARFMLYAARRRAKDAKIEFSITEADIVIPDVCPVLGISIIKMGKRRSDNSPSLDRMDNNKGYVGGNVRVISWRANNIKSNATAAELLAVARYASNIECGET